jgi:membrane-bound lytic murein transglycosylase A
VKPPEKPLQAARWEEVKGWGEDRLAEAHAALMASCTALARQPLWRPVCEEAKGLAEADEARLRAFFEARFTPWAAVNPDGSREGTVTGYYEPLLKGSRERRKPYVHGIYGVPEDLLVVDLSGLYPDLKNFRLRGRLEGRKVVPYWSRAELARQEEQLADKALLWVADPIELFFLQVQGSGRVELPDGTRVRVGYADQNGHPYQSIGRWLVERGELKLEEASMQGIQAWARANPKRLNELLNQNPSFVFFRELPETGGGPLGALGVPLTPGRSIAVDPRSVPLGAPVFLATTWPGADKPLRRLMLAQDTGGAIKGVVRADFFWGFGAEAGAQAGRMRQKGEMWVLLPNGFVPKNGAPPAP